MVWLNNMHAGTRPWQSMSGTMSEIRARMEKNENISIKCRVGVDHQLHSSNTVAALTFRYYIVRDEESHKWRKNEPHKWNISFLITIYIFVAANKIHAICLSRWSWCCCPYFVCHASVIHCFWLKHIHSLAFALVHQLVFIFLEFLVVMALLTLLEIRGRIFSSLEVVVGCPSIAHTLRLGSSFNTYL